VTPRGSTKRLLWIHQNYVGDEQVGNRRAAHVVEAFRNRGWTVDVIAPQASYLEADADGERTGPSKAPADPAIHRVRARRRGPEFARRRRAYAGFLWQALWLARRLPRPDLLFVSSPPLPQVALAIGLAVSWRRPLVLEVRDLWPAFLLELKLLRRTPLVPLLEWLEACAYRFADRCIVVSPPFAGYVERMGVPRSRITIVPSGGDPRLAIDDDRAGRQWRGEHGLENRLLFVYAGSFNEAYDLRSVLDTADALAVSNPEIMWLFAGDGRQRELVIARAASAQHVRYLGPLPRTVLWSVLRSADAGIVTLASVPLLRTVIPGKLLEYLAAALPVLAWAGGVTTAILRASHAGIALDRSRPQTIPVAVREFTVMPRTERQAMGRAGREWILAHMRADVLSRQVAEVVEASASRPACGVERRCLRAAIGAARDVIRAKPRRALASLVGQGAETMIQRSFDSWLGEPPIEHPEAPNRGPGSHLESR
jgi:glycosyltransferase involved in cell wall biosynthesis